MYISQKLVCGRFISHVFYSICRTYEENIVQLSRFIYILVQATEIPVKQWPKLFRRHFWIRSMVKYSIIALRYIPYASLTQWQAITWTNDAKYPDRYESANRNRVYCSNTYIMLNKHMEEFTTKTLSSKFSFKYPCANLYIIVINIVLRFNALGTTEIENW